MPTSKTAPSTDVRSFVPRHIGPSAAETQEMLDAIGVKSLDALIDQTVPESIRLRRPLGLPAGPTAANSRSCTVGSSSLLQMVIGKRGH